MKKIILLCLLHFSLSVTAQIKIKITAGPQSKVEILETTETDKEKNQLIISNQFEKDKCTVSLRSDEPVFTFIFGKNGPVSLNKGDASFQFNSSGLVRGYPVTTQRISFPFEVIVRNNSGDILLKDTVINPNQNTGLNAEKDLAGVISSESIGLTKIPIYDATILMNYKKLKPREFVEILNYYLNERTVPADSLLGKYESNEFLKGFIKEALDYYAAKKELAGTGIFGDFIGKGLSSIGGLDVTSIADGAAKFIVKRTKQELSISFFRKLKETLEKTPDMKTVFPQTNSLLMQIDEEIYEYEKYIQNLREAFKNDIREIHRNLPGIIDNHRPFFYRHWELKSALLTACYAAQELDDQAHPGDILANYPIEYLDSIPNKDYKGAIQTIQLLSASLRDTSAKEDASYWVNIKQVRELVNDKLALKIYLGLLLQEAKVRFDSISFKETNLVEMLHKVAVAYDKGFSIYNSYRTYILRFGEKIEALNKMIKGYKDQDLRDSAAMEKYAKYFRTSVDLIEYSVETCNLPIIRDQGNLKEFPVTLKKYFEVAYASTELVVDINRKNYSSAINQAVRIYKLVTNGETGIDKSVASLIKYGSFMATVATAKNSDEVEKAIEAAALPVGSSRIKRVSDFNVSLNAYAGLFYGIEKINGYDKDKSEFNTFGVAAPIGVAASWGHRLFFIPTGKYEWSTSLYLSLIDLGAVTAFRFKDDSTAQVPTIQLKDIFSPGIFLSIGIPKTPLSFNLGAQVGPNLRKVTSTTNDYSDKTYTRYSVSICVDLPLLNLYTKSH